MTQDFRKCCITLPLKVLSLSQTSRPTTKKREPAQPPTIQISSRNDWLFSPKSGPTFSVHPPPFSLKNWLKIGIFYF